MRTRFRFLLPVAATAAAGCAIHPLPENVTRETTLSIARKIRCETFLAVGRIVVERLSESKVPRIRAIARDIATKRRPISSIYRGELDRATLAFWDGYRQTVVGYTFEFLITENNNGSGAGTFGLPFTRGTFSLTISAGKDRQRQNKRTFNVVESLDELAKSEPCEKVGAVAEAADRVYPIAGKVGMAEVIDTFYRLSREGVQLKTFSEQLTFTTAIRGSLKPRIELNPVKNSFRLASADADLTANRTDVHQLTFTLSLPETFKPETAAVTSAKQRVAKELERLRTIDNQERILNLLDAQRVR